ncbi:YbhB/YbcL family Raf kinase inhibitor-like protein [Candidatus Uhrbacteria bacterium]|nr:YbhB/YbcL family Raf kinase inhibitor-like protein [Candidatus Uhrbacteria bacterium]
MRLFSAGIIDSYIEPKFGKFADETDKIQGVPSRSIPISWSDLPKNTKSLALIMQDYDAIPVCGFSWIHWTVANIDPPKNELLENASRNDASIIQGKNSLAPKQICGESPESITNFYGGPRPPDKNHEYEITLFALDTKLNLSTGFWLNELVKAMRGHILDSSPIYGIYRA